MLPASLQTHKYAPQTHTFARQAHLSRMCTAASARHTSWGWGFLAPNNEPNGDADRSICGHIAFVLPAFKIAERCVQDHSMLVALAGCCHRCSSTG